MTDEIRRIIHDLQTLGLWAMANEVANRHHVRVASMLGRSREPSIAEARKALYRELGEKTFMSDGEIAKLLRRDRTTVWKCTSEGRQRSKQAAE